MLCLHRASWYVAVAMALGTMGCAAFASPAVVRPVEPVCARPVNERSARAGENDIVVQRPMRLVELLQAGNAVRDLALQEQREQGVSLLVQANLEAAQGCYARALSLSPENYDASVGLGVVFIALARGELASSARRNMFLGMAKRQLGIAYMVRRGAYEPVYYLAEAAVLEERYPVAEALLDVLEKARYRIGSVGALQGYVHEKTGNSALAALHYEMVLKEGWPVDAVQFAQRRLGR